MIVARRKSARKRKDETGIGTTIDGNMEAKSVNRAKWVIFNLAVFSCLAVYAEKPEDRVRSLMVVMDGAAGSVAGAKAARVTSTRPVFAAYQARQEEDAEVPKNLLQPKNSESDENEGNKNSNPFGSLVLFVIAGSFGISALIAAIGGAYWEIPAALFFMGFFIGLFGYIVRKSNK